MASRNLNARQPAKNISAAPPTRKTMVNGVPVTEKISPLWGIKMVSPDGDVGTVTLSTGYTIRGFKGNEHGVQKLAEKQAAGFVIFADCPVAARQKGFSREEWGPACEGKFSDEKCCPHIDKLIASRREAYRKTQMDYAKNFTTQQDRLLAHLERQAEQSVSERPGSQPGKKAPIGG